MELELNMDDVLAQYDATVSGLVRENAVLAARCAAAERLVNQLLSGASVTTSAEGDETGPSSETSSGPVVIEPME